jgi:hypothetical protein
MLIDDQYSFSITKPQGIIIFIIPPFYSPVGKFLPLFSLREKKQIRRFRQQEKGTGESLFFLFLIPYLREVPL